MPYELECGHCGFQFVLDAWPLPRSVQCSVCGGRLTLAVPLSPPTAPDPPKPPPVPELLPDPPADEASEDDEDEPEEPDPRPLAPPWSVVHDALNIARTAAEVGGILYAAAMVFDLFVSPFTSWADGGRATDRMLTATVIALIIPVLIHIGAMCFAAQIPPAYGGRRVLASVVLVVLAVFAAGAVYSVASAGNLSRPAVIGLTTCTALLFFAAAFAVWLTALARFGACLGSDSLTERAQAVRTWFPFWIVLVASFLTCSMVGESANAPPIAWTGRALLAGTVLAAFWHYSGLLALAVDVVARRAPDAR